MGADDKDRLAEELARLSQERERVLAGVDAVGDDPADMADRTQVVEMRGEVERIDTRIAELRAALEEVGGTAPDDGTVRDGTVVELRFDDGERQTVRVGGVRITGDDTPVVTAKSPAGQALIGRAEGETVAYDGPRGERRVTIESVRPSR